MKIISNSAKIYLLSIFLCLLLATNNSFSQQNNSSQNQQEQKDAKKKESNKPIAEKTEKDNSESEESIEVPLLIQSDENAGWTSATNG
ncbi:MAG: hypothetical protein R3C41_00790 [Calditrichia bacterium]